MTSENAAPPNDLVAAVLSAGIRLGLVGRPEVVAWADWLIEQSEDPPPAWLIDLSLSQNLHQLNVLAILNRLAQGVDRVAICKAIYGLIQLPTAPTPHEAEVLAEDLYRTTFDLLEGDWKRPLLGEADDVADAFQFIRDGYLKMSPQRAIDDVRRFLEENRDCRVKDLLDECMQDEARSKGAP